MYDTMTMTKAVGAICGMLLVFLLGGWASETIFHAGGGHGGHGEAQAYVIETGAEEPAAAEGEGEAFDLAAALASADPAAGAKVFGKCAGCHKLDGTDGTGPHLNGVVGRGKGAVAGFPYSEALAGMAGDTWTPENIYAFIENPKGYLPGTKMVFNGLPKQADRVNLIAYLQQTP
jgi:cytochrome c